MNTKKTKEEILKAYADGVRDFRGLNLADMEFSNCTLTGADFTGSDLWPRTDFWGANLEGCKFDDAFADAATFAWANCRNTSWKNAQLSWANLCGADFTGADLRGARLSDSKQYQTIFSGAKFYGEDAWENFVS